MTLKRKRERLAVSPFFKKNFSEAESYLIPEIVVYSDISAEVSY
jgi:hypothetical protein